MPVVVMAGHVPVINAFLSWAKDVDDGHEVGHDGENGKSW
jgi:hypothetical protein